MEPFDTVEPGRLIQRCAESANCADKDLGLNLEDLALIVRIVKIYDVELAAVVPLRANKGRTEARSFLELVFPEDTLPV